MQDSISGEAALNTQSARSGTVTVEQQRPLPVTLLTGFLGAGKTTLVNHILSGSHGRKIGVIVNEFGELGIDAALITGASGSVIELANGCICCATQGDLSRSLCDIAAAGGQLEALLIETSGLADPEPVIAELQFGRVAAAFRLDGVITVIDAVNFDRNLDYAEAAFQQIVSGDLLIINKVDLIAPEIPSLIEQGIRTINPNARFIRAVQCDIPLDIVFGIGGHVVGGREAGETLDLHEHGHDHEHHHHGSHDGFESVSFRLDGPLDPERFTSWLDELGPNVFRAKGFVRLVGAESPVVVHLVGSRRSVEPAPAGVETQGAALVVIGQELSVRELQAGLEKCAA
jgi:G3E family GTPase